MIFIAHSRGALEIDGGRVRCALGKAGVVPAAVKREGDGTTPVGVWPLRRLLYRPDRGPPPESRLPMRALTATDGWCDDPADSRYNSPVDLPYPASAERLWREDSLYDRIVVLGHNDDPVVADAGSAIFLHIATDGYAPTQGCIALSAADMATLLSLAGPGDALAVLP